MWGVEFQYPYRLLWLIPVILIPLIRRHSFYWLGFNMLVAQKPARIKRLAVKLGNGLFLLTLLSAVIAYAQPIYGQEEKEIKIKASQACLAYDMSGSMFDKVSKEIQEKRIVVAANAGKEFIDARLGDMFALVPFDDRARMGLAVPMTLDGELIKRQMQAITTGESGGSTAVGEGVWTCAIYLIRPNLPKKLKLDANLLRAAVEEKGLGSYAYEVAREMGQLKHVFIVVLTDGESNAGIDPVKALMLAGRLGIRVYFISATEERFSQLAHAVDATGGRYFAARNMAESKRFYSEINQIEKREVVSEKKIIHRSLKWYLLIASAVFLFASGLVRLIVVKVP